MNRAAYKITRVVFEIGLRGSEQVTIVQNRISAFAGGPLETALIQSLSALTNEAPLLLDAIELNIGNVSYHRLEEDLAAAIARCMREWVLRLLSMHRVQSVEPALGLQESGGISGQNVHHLPGSAAPLFSFRSSASRGGLNAAIVAALQGPGDWPQLMAAVRNNHAFRCRLANEVSPKLLRDLLLTLVPADGTVMAETSGLLASLSDCVSPAPADCHVFRRVLWECILNEVARYQPAKFSLRSFVTNILNRLAARYSLERSVISSRIGESLRQRPPSISLPAISPSLRQALFDYVKARGPFSPATTGPVTQDAIAAKSSQPIDKLARFLEWGALPGSAISGSSPDIDSDMLKAMLVSPEAVCSLIRRLGAMQPVRKRIAGQLAEKAAQHLVNALDPVNAPWIFVCQQSLRRLHAQKPLVPLQNRTFAQLLQELTLEYLAEHNWHALDAVSFMRFLLQGLAARQKTEYELLLADVALRRSAKSRDTAAQSLVHSAIVPLLEEMLGIRGLFLDAPRFVVRPAYQHLYCDLDVLAYWLRWRTLPTWSFAATPEEMAGRIGPLLRELPPEARTNAVSSQAKSPIVIAGTSDSPAPALQIEHWLLYGIWPASVSLPRNTTLTEWLESQSDSDWLQALRSCGAQDSAVQRVVNHLSATFLLRVASLLAGPRAQAACGLLHSLSDLKEHIGVTTLQHWEHQVRRYILIYLLQQISSDSHEPSCTEELAHTILQALSLNCQVPYERLLLLLRQKSQGKEAQLGLCLDLEAKLDHLKANADLINPESLACDLEHGPDLVLHYLQHGSLPEHASGLSFHALQQIAGRLTGDQMASVAHAALPWFTDSREIASRTAILFSSATFAQLAALLLPGIRFTEEIESVLSALASRLSLQPAPLLIEIRAFFLQHAASHVANFSKDLVISGMVEKLAEYTGEPQSTLMEHVVHATGGKGMFADALASLPREFRFMPIELHDPVIAGTVAQPADELATDSDALQELEKFLHLGILPSTSSPGQLMERVSEGLIRNPPEYSSVLRSAATREPERRRMARVFSDSLYRSVCRLLLSDSDFADNLEHALRALAPHFHADSRLLVVACREELLRYAATNAIGASAESMEKEILKSLSESLEKRTGIQSTRWLRHLAGILGVNVLFLPEAGAEKERIKPVLEEAKSEACTLPRDTIAELAAPEQNKNENVIEDQQQGEIQVLAHFLRTGHMSWWGHPLLSLSSGWFQSLLESQPGPVLQIFRSLAGTSQAIDRVMRYLPRPDLTAIILKAVPGYGGILILYIEAGTELAQDRDLAGVQGARIPGIHWRETLLFVLNGETSKSLPSAALRTLCGRTAQKLDIKASHYLEKLLHISSRHAAESGYAALAEMLSQIQTSASSTEDDESTGENVSGNGRESEAKARRWTSSMPDIRKATRPTTCKESSLLTSECENIEETGLAEGPAFPNETVLTGQLEHLLRYGVLPQAMPKKSLPQFMNDLAQAFIFHPEKYRKQMQKAAGCRLERKRIAWLFSSPTLRHLWPLLLPSGHEQAVLCLDALSAAAISCSGGGVNESIRMACAEELLHVASGAEKSRWGIASFLHRAIRRLEEDYALRPVEVAEHMRKELASRASDFQGKLGAALDRVERETALIPFRSLGKSISPVLESRRIAQTQKAPTPLPAGEPFYVRNAGAILLWPFLSRYFQMLELLEKDSFRGEEEQSRAIHLVQYLATGKLEAPEHELLLNKLLCGAKPEQPLHPVTAVTQAEEDLAQQLLNSVIQIWKKISNTSIDGLRQSFLMREGKLLRRDSDDSWLLTVSAKSYDMLLDSLPWRLSLVRQPWMQTTLHVKWR